MYFIKTQRLGFRYWTEADFLLATKLWGDPRVTHFIDARRQLSADQVRGRLLDEITMMKTHAVQYWPIFQLNNESFVGACGLRPYKTDERIFELGVHICFEFWGKGYAAEAGPAVIKYAFEVLGAKELFAGHHPENSVSRRLLQKIGFHYTHDEFYMPTGLSHPSYVFDFNDFLEKRKF